MRSLLRMLLLGLTVLIGSSVSSQVLLPKGKGMWFYILPKTGNPKLVARGMKSAGFDYVLLKVHEGSRMYGPNIGYFDAFAREFKNQHLKVYVWGFNYARPASVDSEDFPTGYQQEAKLITQLLDDPLVDGYVFNWELNATNVEARQRVLGMVKTVVDYRNSHDETHQKPIGWSTHGLYLRHQGLPVAEFVKGGIDYVSPQMYWTESKMPPAAAVETSWKQWTNKLQALGSSIPIIPTGQVYIGHWGRGPADGEATEFVKANLAKGAQAMDFWRYPQGKSDKARMSNVDDVLTEVNEAMTSGTNNSTGIQAEGPTFGLWWSILHSPLSLWDWLGRAYWQGLLLVILTTAAAYWLWGLFESGERLSFKGIAWLVVTAIAWPVLVWLLAVVTVIALIVIALLLTFVGLKWLWRRLKLRSR